MKGGECKIQIKLRLTPKKYRLEVWDQKSSDENVFHQFIEDRLGSNIANRKGHKENKTGSIIMDEFAYGEEADIVADELNDLIKKLA